MSFAIVSIIHGFVVDKEDDLIALEEACEAAGVARLASIEPLYLAEEGAGSGFVGFVGVRLCNLRSYTSEAVGSLKLAPTGEDVACADAAVKRFRAELQALIAETVSDIEPEYTARLQWLLSREPATQTCWSDS
jgi:hypothetical protein